MKTSLFILPVLLLLAALPAGGAETTASASFDPPVVGENESAIYRLTFRVEGSGAMGFQNAGPPRLPRVDGLRLRYLGPNQAVRIDNGQASVRLTHLYRAEPSGPGEYEIPAFAARFGGTRIEVPAARLEVAARGDASDPDSARRDRRPVWMEIGLPRETLYVGEAVPTEVRLFVDNRRITSASLQADTPEKIGDAFSIGDFGPMRQDRTSLDGTPVTTAEWDALLTPLKTGPHPLVFELPLVVALRDSPGRRPDPFGSLFGRSPFDRFFDREEVRAYSEDREVEILPLPEKDRPADFTGGIGRFRFAGAGVSSDEIQVGEPFLYEIRIEGRGNFDRIEPPVFAGGEEDWREYSPETAFTPGDGLGYSGTKRFTFTLVPRSEGITATPPFAFSYFSPEEGEYRTVEIPPRPITVTPAPAGSRPPETERAERNPVEARRGPDLLPLQTRWPGGSGGDLRPPPVRPFFLAVQTAAGGALLGAFLFLRHRRKLRDDPAYARRHRARREIRRGLAEAAAHADAGRAGDFYRAACRVIQESVGPRQTGEPGSLTRNEVIALIGRDGPAADIRHFFRTAEAIRYGARPAAAADLPGELARLRDLARSLRQRRDAGSTAGTSPPPVAVLVLLTFLLAPPTGELAAQSSPGAPPGNGETAGGSGGTAAGPTIPADEAEAKSVFAEAVAAYQQEDFAAAASGFRSLLSRFGSAAVHYNLANALYRLGSYPGAILHYERAFALDPGNPDIAANLALAREAAGLETPAAPPLAAIGHRLSWSAWTWLAALGAWGLLAVLALARTTGLPSLWRNSLLLAFGGILLLSLAGQTTWIAGRNDAVVLTGEAPLRIAPTATSPIEERLPGGTVVRTGERYGDFRKIRTPEDTTGWLLQSSVERIRGGETP